MCWTSSGKYYRLLLRCRAPKSRPEHKNNAGNPRMSLVLDRMRLAGLARPRVGLAIDLEQLRGVHVRVTLRRAEAGVAEQLLDDPQVGAALQQVGRERMA